jgi:hypothetical protein
MVRFRVVDGADELGLPLLSYRESHVVTMQPTVITCLQTLRYSTLRAVSTWVPMNCRFTLQYMKF